MRGLALCLCVGLAGQVAWAEAPSTSLRPMPRPSVAAPLETGAETAKAVASAPMLRPKPRPEPALTIAAPFTAPINAPSLRPKRRPETLLASATPGPMAADEKPQAPEEAPKKKVSKKGSVCGDPDIKGETLAPIKGKVKGCGLDQPVRVTSVSGIRLNQPATISCETASALKSWIKKGLRPAMGKREVVEIRIAASYACRPRNNKKGAKISEHGRGRAIDVAGFVFSDGTQWSVLKNYNKQTRRAHKAACGIFGTTLGPGSDGYHEDHLHFDIASYRGGPYCK